MKLLMLLPFSYMWYLKKIIGKPKTVLDLGCGDGELMAVLSEKGWDITGVDIYANSLKKAKRRGVYRTLIKGDLVKVCTKLVSKKKKYDLVFCSQVIEHVEKSDGEKLLTFSNKLARRKIYFGTPRGFMNQPETFLKGNPYQVHKSGWDVSDFTKRGFRVYGVGFWPVWSENGLARKGGLGYYFFTFFSYIFSPLTFLLPNLGSGMMAVKIK